MTALSCSHNDAVTKIGVLNDMVHLFPWLKDFRQLPISTLATKVFDASPIRNSSAIRNHAMSRLQSCIRLAATRSGCDEHTANRMAAGIGEAPVLQAGPHMHLVIDPDAYFTHLFSVMGLKSLERKTYVSYAVSTVKFVERSRKGPGWLNVDGAAINLFGLTRREMIPYSICARKGAYRFRLINADNPDRDSEIFELLRSLLPKDEFVSAAEALKAANRILWGKYFGSEIAFLQIDDDNISDLVIEHLTDGTSWLFNRLVHDVTFTTTLLDITERVCNGPWAGWFKSSTDLFWGNDDGRLISLRFNSALRQLNDEPSTFSVQFTPNALVEALEERKIIPNLFLMFLVTSMLPGVRVLGGSRHPIYYPLMRHIFCATLNSVGSDPELLCDLTGDERPGIWGHRVLSASIEPLNELLTTGVCGIDAVLDNYRDLPLDEACGDLGTFVNDPMWSNLSAALQRGDITVRDDEWMCS